MIAERALETASLSELMAAAEEATLSAHGQLVTYSRKIFIPLTRLCRDVCHYCTFAKAPRDAGNPFMNREEVLELARAGERAGCREALFTLGDRPEARYAIARDALATLGRQTTLSYLADMARMVLDETSLLPHLNPGLMGADDYAMLRPHAASMGIMLESTAERLCDRGGPHYGSPDKHPAARLQSIKLAGEARVPFTTGLLIGIGESRSERIAALTAIRDLHARYGHIQEVIIQNFRAKPGTRMAAAPEPSLEEHLWTIAAARLILGPEMTIQAPPNLHQPGELEALLRAGVNDWGGVSPVTPDHVNPEAPWPHLDSLAEATSSAGRVLHERLAIGPKFAQSPAIWLDPGLRTRVLRSVDARGLPKIEEWVPGSGAAAPAIPVHKDNVASPRITRILDAAEAGDRLGPEQIVTLFEAAGDDFAAVVTRADRLRKATVGEVVTYVVNRNINYTNICSYKCGFCAFSKGSTKSERGAAYRLELEEIGHRALEASCREATEVCLQGGIHPHFDGRFYLDVLSTIRALSPSIHIHAFSPLEVLHGARSLGVGLRDYLVELKAAGLSTLPGTAAEVLDPEVRAILCPDKLSADEWLGVMRTAHDVGLRSTATIMFGHVDQYRHWARHLLAIRDLQEETGGFTEFVPLPFVHMEAPIWRKGRARSGPSHRECVLMHAVARLTLHPLIPNIQASWVKMGVEGAAALLNAGVNDLGGVLMDESITRAAGGLNGQSLVPEQMVALAASVGRPARQRTTLYGEPVRDLHVAA